mmetsp:Transcript_12551/g.50231  ORF Transcript_12551/g.50231 Transcript_12551/m.50231 type:complete len:213 (-) Transcript_12551:553-1191(-)
MVQGGTSARLLGLQRQVGRLCNAQEALVRVLRVECAIGSRALAEEDSVQFCCTVDEVALLVLGVVLEAAVPERHNAAHPAGQEDGRRSDGRVCVLEHAVVEAAQLGEVLGQRVRGAVRAGSLRVPPQEEERRRHAQVESERVEENALDAQHLRNCVLLLEDVDEVRNGRRVHLLELARDDQSASTNQLELLRRHRPGGEYAVDNPHSQHERL